MHGCSLKLLGAVRRCLTTLPSFQFQQHPTPIPRSIARPSPNTESISLEFNELINTDNNTSAGGNKSIRGVAEAAGMAETNLNSVSSGTDRRATMRTSMRLPLNDEGDYDLEAMGISDGFRPTANPSAGRNRISSPSSQHERRSTPPPRPSSVTKPRNIDNFALRHDGAMGASSRHAAIASTSSAGSITRSSSVSTDMPVMRAESPYQGPSGPSHPYHMYPQNTRLARTASVATASTIPAPSERLYTGPLGPTRPYGMYPQNTLPELESGHGPLPVATIPVGFPGLGSDYQRRLGPDGEEAADIIGPLGHTEQLPPYTKYPDEAFARKTPPIELDLSGAGGIGLATRNPEFASTEDLNSPLSRQSSRSMRSDASEHQINLAALQDSEKPLEKKWKTIARRKVWGIVPVWVFVLVGIICFLFAVIVGTTVGLLLRRKSGGGSSPNRSGHSASGTIYSTVTTTYDVLSMSTVPTNIPSLPTGTFLLPISTPFVTQQTCLDSVSLYLAWSCAVPLTSIYMTVSPIVGSTSSAGSNKITISQSNMSLTYFYGSQPPIVGGDQILSLVQDTQQSQFSPAWFFEALYDKLVVVPEKAFSAFSQDKRENNARGSDLDDFFSRKSTAQTGDKPWFCYWNGTLLEAFIYVNKTSASGAQQAAASAAAAQTTGPIRAPYPGNFQGQPSATMMPPSTPSSTDGGQYEPLNMLVGYPKLVKLEERRSPVGNDLIAPYCVQMAIKSDGTAVRFLDGGGQPNIIYLNETEPVVPLVPSAGVGVRDSELLPRQNPRLCQCGWFST